MMKTKAGRKEKPQLYSHIASAIIPVAGIVAVPSAAQHFPRQNTNPREEWGPLASTLLRASFTSQMLIPSSQISSLNQNNDDDDDDDDGNAYQPSRKRTPIGKMDASTDEDESDEEKRKRREVARASTIRSSSSRSASLSDAQKRLFGHMNKDEEAPTTTAELGLSSTIYLDAKQPQNAEISQSTTTTTTPNDKNPKRATVTITRQHVPPLILNPAPSQSGPSSAKVHSQVDGIDVEGRSTTTARSSLNESTTIPTSARSVSFKEPIIYETYDPPSSKSQQSTTVTAINRASVLDRIVIPPPEEYQQNSHEVEKRNQLLNEEIQQLRLNNRNLQRQQEELLNRLQTLQKLSQRELNDLLKQAGHDQTKDLDNLNKTLQNRCDQLQNELVSLQERYTQDQGQSSARELKNENHFLKDYIHRLNVAASDYQTLHPPDALRTETNKDQRKMQGLPMKGPSPIWLLNQKFLAPLFICYDEKLHEREEFIRKLQSQLNELHTEMKLITSENLSLHERLARTSSTIINQHATHSPDMENIKRQAYLVLEENKVLQEQLNLQTNRLTDVQKAQIQEVSNLTRRLMIIESEKTDGDRTVETIRMKNEELRKKYDQLIVANDHRIDVEDHVREVGEMKRLTDELSEKHASEMQLLLRRVQEAEAAKRSAQLKLSEHRSDMERLKSDIKATKKLNQKLQIRVQTFEKKLELEQMKGQQTTVMLDKATDEAEKCKLEQEAYAKVAKAKEDEMNKTKERMQEEQKKLNEVEKHLENYKSKKHVNEVQEQLQQQYDNLKERCSKHEQRIQQLITLVNERQIHIDDLNSEKRNLEVDLETIWQTTNADNKRMLEHLHDMRVTS